MTNDGFAATEAVTGKANTCSLIQVGGRDWNDYHVKPSRIAKPSARAIERALKPGRVLGTFTVAKSSRRRGGRRSARAQKLAAVLVAPLEGVGVAVVDAVPAGIFEES
jgi:hypothetical protein